VGSGTRPVQTQLLKKKKKFPTGSLSFENLSELQAFTTTWERLSFIQNGRLGVLSGRFSLNICHAKSSIKWEGGRVFACFN
jgi:hypothetical protein